MVDYTVNEERTERTTQYDGATQVDMASSVSSSQKKTAGKLGLMLIMAAVAVAGLLAVYYLFMRQPAVPVPPPQAMAPKQEAPAPAEKPAPDPAPAAEPVAEQPAENPQQPAFDPLTGVPLNGADTAVAVNGVQVPADGTAVVPGQAPGQAPVHVTTQTDPAVSIDPLTGMPVTATHTEVTVQQPVQNPAMVQQPVAQPAGATTLEQIRSDLLAGIDRLSNAFAETETRLTTRIDDLSARQDSFESRLTAIETGRAALGATAAAGSASEFRDVPRDVARKAPVRKKAVARRAPVKKKKVVAKAPVRRSTNRIQVVSATEGASPSVSAPAPSRQGCTLKAVQEGKFWVENADGTWSTYVVGDTLPSGGRVTSASARNGIQVNGRRWACN